PGPELGPGDVLGFLRGGRARWRGAAGRGWRALVGWGLLGGAISLVDAFRFGFVRRLRLCGLGLLLRLGVLGAVEQGARRHQVDRGGELWLGLDVVILGIFRAVPQRRQRACQGAVLGVFDRLLGVG